MSKHDFPPTGSFCVRKEPAFCKNSTLCTTWLESTAISYTSFGRTGNPTWTIMLPLLRPGGPRPNPMWPALMWPGADVAWWFTVEVQTAPVPVSSSLSNRRGDRHCPRKVSCTACAFTGCSLPGRLSRGAGASQPAHPAMRSWCPQLLCPGWAAATVSLGFERPLRGRWRSK